MPGEQEEKNKAGRQAEGNAKGAGGDEKKAGGDLSVALKQEREQRRLEREQREAIAKENEELKRQMAEQLEKKKSTGKPDAKTFDLSDLELQLTEDEIIGGDVKSVNEKIRKGIEAAAAKALETARLEFERRFAAESASASIEKLIGKYEIFDDEDPELARDAQAAAVSAVAALEEGVSLDVVDTAIAEIAKRFSRYKIARSATPGDHAAQDAEKGPLGTGPGGSEASHLNPGNKPAETLDEARQRAKSRAARWLSRMSKSQQ